MPKAKKEDSFFEEDTIKKEQDLVEHRESKYGEFYNKNVIYKYKDGINTTVTYNKSQDYVERIMK